MPWKKIALYILTIIVTIVYAFPLFWIVLSTFKDRVDIFAIPPKLIPYVDFKPTLDNYEYVIIHGGPEGGPGFWGPLFNSIFMSITSVIVATILSLFCAYAFSRFNVTGSNTMMFFILSLRMMPPVAVAIPIFLMYRSLHLIYTYHGMIILYTMFGLPFALWMLKGFMDEIPRAYDEAAMADGASTFKIIYNIILPQMGTAIAATIIFNIIFIWNEFLYAFLLSGGGTRTIPISIAMGLYTRKGIDWEYISTLSTIYSAPVIVGTFFLQRYLLRGLTFGTIRR